MKEVLSDLKIQEHLKTRAEKIKKIMEILFPDIQFVITSEEVGKNEIEYTISSNGCYIKINKDSFNNLILNDAAKFESELRYRRVIKEIITS